MEQVIVRSRSRKVNGYVKAVLALDAVRRKREDRYDRFVRRLDRKRDELAAEVAERARALNGGQQAAAQRILGGSLPRPLSSRGAEGPAYHVSLRS